MQIVTRYFIVKIYLEKLSCLFFLPILLWKRKKWLWQPVVIQRTPPVRGYVFLLTRCPSSVHQTPFPVCFEILFQCFEILFQSPWPFLSCCLRLAPTCSDSTAERLTPSSLPRLHHSSSRSLYSFLPRSSRHVCLFPGLYVHAAGGATFHATLPSTVGIKRFLCLCCVCWMVQSEVVCACWFIWKTSFHSRTNADGLYSHAFIRTHTRIWTIQNSKSSERTERTSVSGIASQDRSDGHGCIPKLAKNGCNLRISIFQKSSTVFWCFSSWSMMSASSCLSFASHSIPKSFFKRFW